MSKAFDHQQLTVFFRGEFVPFSEATISIANTGFMYGLGVFTGMRVHVNPSNGKLYLFRPDAHYKRFYNSCKLLRYNGFTDNVSCEDFVAMLTKLVRINNVKQDSYIRVTNFSDENLVTPKLIDYKDSLCAFLYPLGDYVPTGGMRCKVSSWTRADDNAVPARAKINGLYVNTAFAKTEALTNGYDEAIFLDSRGHVVEGSAENLFLVRDSKLITPPVSDNILEGVTRGTIIELALGLGLDVVERSIDRSELYCADEILLTGTGAQVSPVIEVDGVKVGTGSIGDIGGELQKLYSAVVRGEDSRYSQWLVDIYGEEDGS